MKRILAVLLTTASITVAQASEKPNAGAPSRTSEIAAPGWTGFYVNAGGGYSLWTAATTAISTGTGGCNTCVTQTQGGQGWLGTVGVGFDYQFAPAFLGGVFGGGGFGSIKGTIQNRASVAADTTMTSAWAIGGRAGWLATPDLLAYVTGGYTGTRFSGGDLRETRLLAPSGYWTPSTTAHGWFIGAGTEIAIAPNWFWRNEYRYASYGSTTRPLTNGIDTPVDVTFRPTVQTVTTQIVFKLGAGQTPHQTAPSAPQPIWSGFYVSGGFGYGGWTADTTILSPTTQTCVYCLVQRQGGRGWLGRIGAGFDRQIMPRLMIGAFADFDLSKFKGSVHDHDSVRTADLTQKSTWAVGARAGWLVTPRILGYGNGGYNQARFAGANMLDPVVGMPTRYAISDTTLGGWFVGGGIETTLTSNLFWRNEYRFAHYDSASLTERRDDGFVDSIITFKPTVQTFTTQLVFKLDALR